MANVDTVESVFDTLLEVGDESQVPLRIKLFIEAYNGKTEHTKTDLNKHIKILFESSNVNFLMGSGYCFERLRTLGDLESLIVTNQLSNFSDPQKMNAIEGLILYDFFRNSIYPHKYDIDSKLSFENSDRFISKLAAYLNGRNDKNLIKRVNIFTTNYDMFFELSLEHNNIYYNDGFSGRLSPSFSTQNYNRLVKQIVQNTERESQIPTVNLYKLHGSLAWDGSSENIGYNIDPGRLIDAVESAGAIFNHPNFMYEKTGTVDVREVIESIEMLSSEFDAVINDQVNDFMSAYKKLHIINPTKRKFEETLLSNIYYDLLRMYSNELEKSNSVLFVFGFSFKDEHIFSITKRALSNPSMMMYIFVFDEAEVSNFKALFKECHNVFFVYSENKRIDLMEFNSLMFGDHR